MLLYKYTYREVPWNKIHGIKLVLLEFKVIKETPCGYWIVDKRNHGHFHRKILDKPKFVLKEGKNIYARIDKKTALNDFYLKKKKQIEILTSNITILQEAVNTAKKLLEDGNI